MPRDSSPEVGVSVRGFSEGHKAIIKAKEVTGMLGSAARKVAWLARATTTVVGLALVLAPVLGVASTALAGTGVGATRLSNPGAMIFLIDNTSPLMDDLTLMAVCADLPPQR
jgi:hypothetical protein